MKWLVGSLTCTCLIFGSAAVLYDSSSVSFAPAASADGRSHDVTKGDRARTAVSDTEDRLRAFLIEANKANVLQLTSAEPPSADAPTAKPADPQILAQSDSETPPEQDQEAPASEDVGGDGLLAEDDDGGDGLLSEDDDGGDGLLAEDDGGDGLLSEDEDDGDGLLADDSSDDNLLDETAAQTEEPAPEKESTSTTTAAVDHAKLFVESKYPSANTCAVCHPKHYEEWSISSHAYAQLSPVYMAMQIAINMKTSSTTGDFCIRCHNQVGMNLGESIFMSNLDRADTSREGITCVVCHRINQDYGKISGRFALVQGDLYSTIYGPTGGAELNRVINTPEKYRVSTSADKQGRGIHSKAEKFFALTKPNFCGACHDVTLPNGFRLEEAFAEWQQSPAAKRGETCQDCHMGRVQGIKSGYQWGPAATVGDEPTRNRKLTNHVFSGPDYSIIHPGLYPPNVQASEFKTPRQWLQFNHRAGWGTDKFEDNVSEGYRFPKAWQEIDDRYEGREILDEQFKRLAKAKRLRLEVLRNGFKLDQIKVAKAGRKGIDFSIDVRNGTDGHSVPTGFDAERLIFLKVTVRDPRGKVVYVSGDRDPNGDVRDAHSLYVHNGELELDRDLFNLQSKFIVRQARGGEREQVLAVNTSAAALPFVRPDRRAAIIYGRPRGARKHKQTIDPLASRTAKYKVDANRLTENGVYTISIELIAQMVPVNLIAAIQIAGFDYGMSPKGIADAVVRGAARVHKRTIKVRIDGVR